MGRGRLWVRERGEDLPPSVSRAAIPEVGVQAREAARATTFSISRDGSGGESGRGRGRGGRGLEDRKSVV